MAFLGLLAPLLLWGVSFLHQPSWRRDLPLPWRKLQLLSFLSAEGGGLLFAVIAAHRTLPEVLCLSVTTYLTVETAVTDGYLRRASRYHLRTALGLVGLCNGLLLWQQGNHLLLTWTLVAALGAAACLFLPSLMGASDARAFLLSVLLLFPLIGLPGYEYYLFLLLPLFILTHLFLLLRDRRRGVRRRVTLPVVPLLLAPAIFLIAWAGVR